jgi:hypothetical protein
MLTVSHKLCFVHNLFELVITLDSSGGRSKDDDTGAGLIKGGQVTFFYGISEFHFDVLFKTIVSKTVLSSRSEEN